MMTSKSDPRGHPGLKLCVHVSVKGYYRFINFHQNRRGSGIFLGDFTWNDPYIYDLYVYIFLISMFLFWLNMVHTPSGLGASGRISRSSSESVKFGVRRGCLTLIFI